MKIASRVLGILVIIMLVVSAVFVFVSAVSIKNVATTGENTGDVAEALQDSVAFLSAFFGTIGFIVMCIIGCVLILYIVAYIISYIRLYYAKCNISFINYGAVVFGLLTFFAILMTLIKPSAFYSSLIISALTLALMIAYAIVAKKYMISVHGKEYFGYNRDDDEDEDEDDSDDEDEDGVYEDNVNPYDIRL